MVPVDNASDTYFMDHKHLSLTYDNTLKDQEDSSEDHVESDNAW